MNVVATAGLLALTCLLLSARGLKTSSTRPFVLWSSLFVFIYATSTDLRRIFPQIPRFPGHYNWTGKAFELLVCVSAVAILTGVASWKLSELGLTFRFHPATGRDVVKFLLPVLALELVALFFLLPGQTLTWEDHLFQLTAPGLTEELAFRGVLMALLDRAFLSRKTILGAKLGWSAVVTSILFGLWHGLDVNKQFHISFDVASAVIPLLGGFVLAWCRARSGSLLLPFLVHAGMNEVANLIGGAKHRNVHL